MNTKRLKRLIGILVIGCMLLGNVLLAGAAETFEVIGDVTPSKEAYVVDISDGFNNFLRNKKAVDLSVGKRYYMTYTVDEVESNALQQNGIVIGQDKEKEYPYSQGMMHYAFDGEMLFEPGYTYFYRVEVTKEGFDYLVAKVSEKDSSWMEFPLTVGNINKTCQYFGIWLGGSPENRADINLSAVLCYDEDGNDLGVEVGGTGAFSVYQTKGLEGKDSGHYYEFSLNDATFVAISNARPTDSNVFYMSYTVENLKENTANQAGVGYTRAPRELYPHGKNGLLKFTFCDESPLLREGADYLIRAEVQGDTVSAVVKETYKGKETIFAMPLSHGTLNEDAQYFYWWFGEGAEAQLTVDFKNFRCYDEKGRNLGVQLNQDNINIKHYGNLEDYTYCEAVYYCKANDTMIILDDECNAGMLIDEEGQDTKWGTYTVNGTTLNMTIDGQEQSYKYLYEHMTDAEGNRYLRLGKKTVEFVSGAKDKTSNKFIEVSAETGYKVAEPEAPVVENFTFDAWCLLDGTEYDFSDVVTESFTLYARYTDGNGHEYLAVDAEIGNSISAKAVTIIAVSTFLVTTTVIGIVLLVKKGGRKNGNQAQKEK